MGTRVLKIVIALLLASFVQFVGSTATSAVLADGCPAGTHYDTVTGTCR
jgi:hypothetical protein